MIQKIIIFITIVALSFNICFAQQNQQRRKTDMLELPAYSNKFSHQVIYHFAYTTSYNKKHKIPNWVAWRLLGENVVNNLYERDKSFYPDPNVLDCPDGSSYEYSKYQYARGHMCPAGDNKWSKDAIFQCNYMTNICPQQPKLNNGSWKKLEERCSADSAEAVPS